MPSINIGVDDTTFQVIKQKSQEEGKSMTAILRPAVEEVASKILLETLGGIEGATGHMNDRDIAIALGKGGL